MALEGRKGDQSWLIAKGASGITAVATVGLEGMKHAAHCPMSGNQFATHFDAFEAGMRAGEIARWIPVEEKLPPKNTKVLVWFRENTTTGPVYIPRFGEISCGHWRPEGGNGNFDERVTHWQPLPAAPEEKK